MVHSKGRALARVCVMAVAIGTFAANAARAEDAPANKAETSPSIAEIVVTAQFRGQKLQDVPIAITAVNAATIEQRGSTNLADLAGSAPNVVCTVPSPASM